MVPKFAKPGKSFKGVMLYLTHDADHATSSARVAWTHTINLAHDDIQGAVDEMHTTALNAEVLKAEHGARGRKTERPTKHFSLNWHPSESPDRAEMIAAVESFLKHMGWDRHQAVIVAHTDKAYRHAHVVLNAIDPETGLKLDDSFERRRAQAWALGYKQEHGQVFCTERLNPVAERGAAEPRPAWTAIKEHTEHAATAERAGSSFDPSYLGREENRRIAKRNEWQILKELQREERLAFFAEGKDVYRELNRTIYREVREEFRPEWSSFYSAKRDGLDAGALRDIRADLVARQNSVLEERFADVAAEKRSERDLEYRELLDTQKDQRGELIDRQELGLRSPHLLDRAYPQSEDAAIAADDRDTSREDALDRFGILRGRPAELAEEGMPAEAARPDAPRSEGAFPIEETAFTAASGSPERPPKRDAGAGLAGGLIEAAASIVESLMGGSGKPAAKPPARAEPLERFGIQRGRPPPGDAVERAAREQRQAHEDWREWREYHHLAEGRER